MFAFSAHLYRYETLAPFALAVAFLAGAVGVTSLVIDRRTRRRIRDGRKDGRWAIGEPYQVQFEFRGRKGRSAGELHVGKEDLSILVDFQEAVSIELAEVKSVRVRRTAIDVHTPHEVLALVPASYADRERLLWELAVRCPDAMDRGMDEDASPAKSSAAPASRTQTSPPPAPDAPSGPAPGASDLALDSALAGPVDRGNPAPPRKSGLGVGLFVPPPGSRPTVD